MSRTSAPLSAKLICEIDGREACASLQVGYCKLNWKLIEVPSFRLMR